MNAGMTMAISSSVEHTRKRHAGHAELLRSLGDSQPERGQHVIAQRQAWVRGFEHAPSSLLQFFSGNQDSLGAQTGAGVGVLGVDVGRLVRSLLCNAAHGREGHAAAAC